MLSDHEKSLLCYLAEEEQWDNSVDGKFRTIKGYPGGIKALIDDATSGGLEAAPIVFDDRVIEAPLLYGELYPLVNEITLDRGRRIEGVSVSTVSGSWGGVDDTAISLFTTTSFVAAFDTTVFRWQGSVKIGLDFLSDTPIDFGKIITTQYGERLLEDLDDVIADGNGTTQPEGIMQSGGTAVTWSSATSLGNYESLRFSVHKREHQGNMKRTAIFCGNETTYMRAKAIPVGTTDARRVFGSGNFGTSGLDDYQIMDRPFKINETLANTEVFYAIMSRYRMYRRKGFTVRQSTEGDTLIRDNELLIIVMARYGGQLERPACAGIVSDAPA
jgi:HK97 family phage major capsid protein